MRTLPILLLLLAVPAPTLTARAPVADPTARLDPGVPAEDARPKVLVLTQSSGFVHPVVKRPEDRGLSVVERSLETHAGSTYDLILTQDARDLLAHLDELDAVVFYTTGELPLWPEERAQLLQWVVDGGAFVGVHCASDTMYATPDYLTMVGGAFDGHPWHQEVSLQVEDAGHPSTVHLSGTWTLTDEVYQFRDWQRFPDSVLLSLTDQGVDLSQGKRADGDYASAWWKAYGRGRVFYTALGHRPELWQDATFMRHVLGGLSWSLNGPDGPVPAPAGADVFDQPLRWKDRAGEWSRWQMRDGAMQVTAGAGDNVSDREFGDALIHVEFRLPPRPPAHEGPYWANSGVYVQGRYELQVLDTAGQGPAANGCGAIYQQHLPRRDATRPTGMWQTYDIRFTAPRFDDAGARSAPARMSVWHNGLLVHDDVELTGVTPGGLSDSESPTGPLLLQDHGDPVMYRNVWVLPAGE